MKYSTCRERGTKKNFESPTGIEEVEVVEFPFKSYSVVRNFTSYESLGRLSTIGNVFALSVCDL